MATSPPITTRLQEVKGAESALLLARKERVSRTVDDQEQTFNVTLYHYKRKQCSRPIEKCPKQRLFMEVVPSDGSDDKPRVYRLPDVAEYMFERFVDAPGRNHVIFSVWTAQPDPTSPPGQVSRVIPARYWIDVTKDSATYDFEPAR